MILPGKVLKAPMLQNEMVYPERQRTRTVRYRTEDPLQNMRIKVIVKAADADSDDWVEKVRVFSWQEKVFGPTEYHKYKELADKGGMTPPEHGGASEADKMVWLDKHYPGSIFGSARKMSMLDEKYVNNVQHVSQGEVIFSYVDVDPYDDAEEYNDSVTTSMEEKPTRLAQRSQESEHRRGKHSKAGLGKAVLRQFQVMYLVGSLTMCCNQSMSSRL